jgi:transposase InsO family protein
VSERRACQLLEVHRSTVRYEAVPSDFEQRLVKQMLAFAEAHPRWGYRRVHALLVADGWEVNVKRVHRLWVEQGLQVPPGKGKHGQKALGADANAAWNLPALGPGDVWSYDFMSARLDNGGPLRILNVVDEYTRECVGSFAAPSTGAQEVRRTLTRLFAARGKPRLMRSDNGREFIADTVVTWLTEQGVTAAFVEKGSPQQNCYVERFNGTMRRELLNGEIFHSVTEARVVIGRWVEHYNHDRPHRGLAMQTPSDFAKVAKRHSSEVPRRSREGGT